MTILYMPAEEFNKARELANLGTQAGISAAWKLLGSNGDAYAFLASAILSTDTATMPLPARVFYEMVRIQWENTVDAGLWGGPKFIEVGQQHLNNYLKLLEDNEVSGGYTLPTTKQIEASYKNALQDNFLLPITAIDSMFSQVGWARCSCPPIYLLIRWAKKRAHPTQISCPDNVCVLC